MNGAKLGISNVVKQYADHRALDDVSLDVEAGSYTVILGPSGSGKTTLLAILGGFTEPSSGHVMVAGEDVTNVSPSRRPTTTVFQDYALFPHMTVGNNVGFGLEMKGVPKKERRARVLETLKLVDLAHVSDRHISELSGGQRQRIALARALIVEPSVLLLDEPLGALDLKLRRTMQHELTRIHRMVGTTFVHVTHDQEEAMSLADNIVILRDGRIEDMGSPARLYLEPATAFSAKFMGDSNVVTGKVQASSNVVETAWGVVEIEQQLTPGESVTLSIRPEHIVEEAEGLHNLGEWTVSEAHFLGERHRIVAVKGNHEILVSVPQSARHSVGDSLKLTIAANMAKVVKGEKV
ncbi:ABC transporter ATP-binding protein [Pontimonas sp.]|nr:ABC transporter ATP-binding protein [Pontimonas sp.]